MVKTFDGKLQKAIEKGKIEGKIKFEGELKAGVCFKIEMPSDITTYASNWLILCNTARCYPNSFFKVENDNGNTVEVTCAQTDLENKRNFLSGFGKIIAEDPVAVICPEMVHDENLSRQIGEDFLVDVGIVWTLIPLNGSYEE